MNATITHLSTFGIANNKWRISAILNDGNESGLELEVNFADMAISRCFDVSAAFMSTYRNKLTDAVACAELEAFFGNVQSKMQNTQFTFVLRCRSNDMPPVVLQFEECKFPLRYILLYLIKQHYILSHFRSEQICGLHRHTESHLVFQ